MFRQFHQSEVPLVMKGSAMSIRIDYGLIDVLQATEKIF